METSLEFMQGVSAAGGGFCARAVAYSHGLFIMNGRTEEFSVVHETLMFHSVDYAGDGKFCGWATDHTSGESFLYEIEIETGELTILSEITNPADINYAQGFYCYDSVKNELFFKGFRYIDPEAGTMNWGLYKFNLVF